LNEHNTNIPTQREFQQFRDPHNVRHKSTSQPSHQIDTFTAEEERRSRQINDIWHAQRRYAEKITTPTGPDNRYTKEEWDSLGETLEVADWEGGFLDEGELFEKLDKGMYYTNHNQRHLSFRKENMSLSSSWKGKEKAVELSADDEVDEVIALRLNV
jgi:hypothetical protein